ncbi:hypothetical protein RI129_011123 [Pyrocoelia pectoralis]|uniref:Uncharacterized protein n=1 Tax=Pyrocoelia pectoralis TaxID=417401 RepID=A0AAN7ZF65_9COLE
MGTIRAVILHLLVFFIFKIYAHHPSTVDRKMKMEEFKTLCLCSSKANPALVEDFFETGTIYTDPCMACFYACLIEKLNLVYPNGTYNLDAWYKFYGGFVLMVEVTACDKTHGSNLDPCAKASGFLQCMEDALNRDPIAEKRP